MTWVLSALTSRLAGPIAAALAVAMACFLVAMMLANAGLKMKVAGLDREINGYIDGKGRRVPGLRQNLATCQDNRAELDRSLTRQNAAVTALKADRDRVAREGARDVANAEAETKTLRQRWERVLRARPGADQCASADRVILESLR